MTFTIVDEIKARFSLEDAIREFVPVEGIRQIGNKLTGHCPFHSDKTPSWSGRLQDNHWHCFGCNLHGDQIDLVARHLNLATGDAVRMLADHLGISRNLSPETRTAVRQAMQERQRERRQKAIDRAVVKEQFNRLCGLEKSVCRILDTIQNEASLNRPEVIAALQVKGQIGYYLDSFLHNSEQDNIKLARRLREWEPWTGCKNVKS